MKIYLSGMHSYHGHCNRRHDHYDVLRSDAPWLDYCFPSFWDWYKPRPDFNGRVPLWTMPGNYVILDSGAHSFFAMNDLAVHGKKRKSVKLDVAHYHGAYMNFVETNWDFISYFVELDVADIFGFEWVEKMRADYKARGLWDKCIPAWHRVNGMADFHAMLDCPSRYIGLQGLRPSEQPLDYCDLIRQAFDAGVRVHGFALINQSILDKFAFYSVDATSWLQSAQYGSIRRFERGRLKTVKTSWQPARRKCAKLESAMFRNRLSLLQEGIAEIKKAEEFFTALWNARGVNWETQLAAMGTPTENQALYPRRQELGIVEHAEQMAA
jgi:hypothetical protein